LLPRVQAELGVALSAGTLRRLARRAGYAWKRMRRSLKARRDAVLFSFFAQELDELHRLETAGALRVVYADEGRFSRHAPVPYAWQVRGQAPTHLPAERGGGLTVLGLWQAKAPDQPLTSYVLPGALTAELFAAALDEYGRTLPGPTVLVLDNASIHRAACVLARQPAWAARGLRLQFLPAYCPELNLIEILWHRCKHYWLTPDDYRSDQTLLERLEQLLPVVGKVYTVTFD
jgi:transposase